MGNCPVVSCYLAEGSGNMTCWLRENVSINTSAKLNVNDYRVNLPLLQEGRERTVSGKDGKDSPLETYWGQ